MVYTQKFVMTVLRNGNVQKELANGAVPIPFNSEYALRFRNKNNRRAVVKIFIDGENVSGNGYIIPANDFIEIERHGDVNKRFKFVSLDSADAHDFGKNGSNEDKTKGVIEARFCFEKEAPKIVNHWTAPTEVHHHHHHTWPYSGPYYSGVSYGSSGTCRSNDSWTKTASSSGMNSMIGGASAQGMAAPSASSLLRSKSLDTDSAVFNFSAQNYDSIDAPCEEKTHANESERLSFKKDGAKALRDGCTVEGESSDQRFSTTWIDLEDTYVSVKVFLQGYDSGKEDVEQVKISKPTVRYGAENEVIELTETQRKIKELQDKVDRLKLEALEKECAELEKAKA